MHAILMLAALVATPAPPINAVVGDASVVRGYVTADADEDARIAGHLRFAHDLLAAVDTSAWPPARRVARARNLARLEAYIAARRFPRNDGHPDVRRPTFVDDRGAICAVGALFAADRGRAAAVRIARTYKYAYVRDIADDELAAWQRASGLTLRELAIIQPGYRWSPAMRGELWTPAGLLDRMLAGPDRVGVSTEVGDGVVATVHGQARFPGADTVYVYGALPLATFATDVAAAGGGISTTRHTSLENAELGVYTHARDVPVLGKLGFVLPTGSEAPPAARDARVGDAALGLPRATGVRATTSLVFPLSVEHCGACSWHTKTSLRLDAGTDVVETLADRAVHVIPRAGVGVAHASERAEVVFEAGVAHVPVGDAGLRWSAGITGRTGTGTQHTRLEPALTLAAVHDAGGLGATLTFELVYAHEREKHPSRDDSPW